MVTVSSYSLGPPNNLEMKLPIVFETQSVCPRRGEALHKVVQVTTVLVYTLYRSFAFAHSQEFS